MTAASVDERVPAEVRAAGLARGYDAELVDGVIDMVAADIGQQFGDLILGPPDHPEGRTYAMATEGLGLVEAICEEKGDHLTVIRLQIEAFDELALVAG